MKRGFTIIEMLIYMGLLSIFLVVMSGMFISILDVHLESQAAAGVQQDGQYILLRLAYDMQRAGTFTVSVDNKTLTSPGFFTYSETGGNLTNGTDVLNGSQTAISNLKFVRLANSAAGSKATVQVSFTLKSLVQRQSGPEVRNFETTVGLR